MADTDAIAPSHTTLLLLLLFTCCSIVPLVHGGKSDIECNLNGVLQTSSSPDVDGKCLCDVPWKGDNCSTLNILKHPNDYEPAYGFSPNVTSWGGNIILGDDGKYHMFVSEMAGGCGLDSWGHVSFIAHAVADDPMDTFKFQDKALGVWAHNAAPVRAPSTHTYCPGCYYLFHIGTADSKTVPNCSSTSDDFMTSSIPSRGNDPSTNSLVHRSKSPNGPWVPLGSNHPGCNNPAPAFDANGTLFVVCNSHTIYRADGDPMSSDANWTKITDIPTGEWVPPGLGAYIRIEDAYLWQDANDNWHFMCHAYDYRNGYPVNPNATKPGPLVSAHAFSRDLFNWYLTPLSQPPFAPTIYYQNGSLKHFSTMERPHLMFDTKTRRPTHLINAVSPVWDQFGPPCCVCDARPGVMHSCVVCKTSKGYDWTYTIVQALATE
eukprot:m.25668 g.25668  ORF g.25668 m.25668 type:complete len:433 (+) comp7728_c0_seq2:22-1320(+)